MSLFSPRIEEFLQHNRDDVKQILLPAEKRPHYSPYPGRKVKRSRSKLANTENAEGDLVERTYHFRIDVFDDDVKMRKLCRGVRRSAIKRNNREEESDVPEFAEEEIHRGESKEKDTRTLSLEQLERSTLLRK